MTTLTSNILSQLDPFSIGFDKVVDRLNKSVQYTGSTLTYPPYNIIKESEDEYVLELAAAGFTEADFNIELFNNVLTVKTIDRKNERDVRYLHKGIAERSFIRKFTLADTIQVENASMINGMLIIRLRNVVPEEKKPKLIPIQGTTQLLNEAN